MGCHGFSLHFHGIVSGNDHTHAQYDTVVLVMTSSKVLVRFMQQYNQCLYFKMSCSCSKSSATQSSMLPSINLSPCIPSLLYLYYSTACTILISSVYSYLLSINQSLIIISQCNALTMPYYGFSMPNTIYRNFQRPSW